MKCSLLFFDYVTLFRNLKKFGGFHMMATLINTPIVVFTNYSLRKAIIRKKLKQKKDMRKFHFFPSLF